MWPETATPTGAEPLRGSLVGREGAIDSHADALLLSYLGRSQRHERNQSNRGNRNQQPSTQLPHIPGSFVQLSSGLAPITQG